MDEVSLICRLRTSQLRCRKRFPVCFWCVAVDGMQLLCYTLSGTDLIREFAGKPVEETMTERNTVQKRAIYEALCALGHPTATGLYDYIHATYPGIGKGTVFRVLAGFAASGRARKLTIAGSDDCFDATLTPHAHARCRVCGGIFDLFFPEAAEWEACELSNGFFAERCEICVEGVCKRCRESSSETIVIPMKMS